MDSFTSPAASSSNDGPSRASRRGLEIFLPVVLALFVSWPVWRDPAARGIHDWPQFYAWYEIPRITLLKFHQLPFWNPYLGGGNPELAHTHSPFLSPFFLPVLLWGSVVGLKICLLLVEVAGMWGMMALTRTLQCRPWPCLLAAGLWGMNGWAAAHGAVGHMNQIPILLLPWGVAWFLQRRIFLVGIFVSLLFFSGAVYPFLLTLGYLALLTMALSFLQRSLRPLRDLCLVGGLALGLSAVKLLPALEFSFVAAPIPLDFSGCDLSVLKRALLSPHWAMVPNFRDRLGSWEYQAYIGWFALGLGAWGFARLNRMGWALLTPGIVGLFLAFGQQDPLGWFPRLQQLPPLGSFHVPFRIVVLFLCSFSVAMAVGLSRWMARFPRAAPWIGLLGVCMLLNLGIVNQRKFLGIFTASEALPRISPGQFRQVRIGFDPARLTPEDLVEEPFHRRMFLEFLRGHGVVDAYDPLHLPAKARAVGDPGYRGELFLSQGREQVRLSRWSPNLLEMEVQVDQPDVLVINQNFDFGWKVLKGPAHKVVRTEGLLGIPVPPGRWEIAVGYRPLSIWIGAWVTAGTVLLGIWRWTVRRTASAIP